MSNLDSEPIFGILTRGPENSTLTYEKDGKYFISGLPKWLSGKEPACQAGDKWLNNNFIFFKLYKETEQLVCLIKMNKHLQRVCYQLNTVHVLRVVKVTTDILNTCYCCSVSKSCLTFCEPMNCRLPGSSAHRLFQARILEWVAIYHSRDQTCISCIARGFFSWDTKEARIRIKNKQKALYWSNWCFKRLSQLEV